MKWLGSLLRRYSAPKSGWTWAVSDEPPASGVPVTVESAQHSSAVIGCVQARAQDFAKLPLILYRRRKDGNGRDRVLDHPSARLAGLRPNSHQTSYEWRETMQAHLDLRGNAYSLIEVDSRNRPVELFTLHPDWVRVILDKPSRTLFYDVRMFGTEPVKRYDSSRILHIKDRSDDGFVGRSVISRAKQVIELDLAQQRHATRSYANGARLSGIISLKGNVNSEGRKLAQQEFMDTHSGSDNAGKVAVFSDEGKFTPTSMTSEDQQFVEQRQMARTEICTLFRVPPHKIGILADATFSNIEHQALEYVTDTMMPIARRWEMALNASLLRESEQGEYYFEFLFDALLRGDTLSRYQAHALAIQWGLKTQNECRRAENLNDEEGGDQLYMPLNMWPANEPRPESAPKPAPAKQEAPPAKLFQIGQV